MSRITAFSIGAIIFSVASVGVAQQFIITPAGTNVAMQQRVWQLERAVQELQAKVFHLQAQQQGNTRPQRPVANPKAFFCSVSAFGNNYRAFGPTRLEARQRTMSQCLASNNKMHCEDVVCEENH